MIKTVKITKKKNKFFADDFLLEVDFLVHVWLQMKRSEEVRVLVSDNQFEGSRLFNLFTAQNKDTAEKLLGRKVDKLWVR